MLLGMKVVWFLFLVPVVWGLDNGLAYTPPMGWLSWERFECNTDCLEDPDNCIGERLLMSIADAMVEKGFLDAGYEYVTIDDCWPAHDRDSQGRLQPDPVRFPSGMKALADYMHARGLKLGLYEDVGRHTCAGAPGSQDHIPQDAQTFADWGVDMIKFDGCNADESYYRYGYPLMAKSLNQTGRHILYSCEWAIYERAKGVKPNYTAVAETCNTFRVYGDIWDAWESINSILNWYGDDPGNFSKVANHGSWNDADMLVVGNYGLSPTQEQVQFGMWCMIASPLLMSVDVRNIREESRQLLLNKRVLSISQDPLAVQATRIFNWDNGFHQIWIRPVVPSGSYAIAFLNLHNFGWPIKMSVNLTSLGMTNPSGYNFSEVFDGGNLGIFKPAQNFTCRVVPNGICLVRATVLSSISQPTRKPKAIKELFKYSKQGVIEKSKILEIKEKQEKRVGHDEIWFEKKVNIYVEERLKYENDPQKLK